MSRRLEPEDLARACWLRAVEQGAPADGRADVRDAVPWGAEDAAWASREARHAVGEPGDDVRASQQAFVAARARLGCERLASRDATWRVPAHALQVSRGWRAWLALAALAVALALAGNVFGPAQRLNLLAPPVLGLMAWNLVVYALLALAAGRGPARWLARAIEALRSHAAAHGTPAPLAAARARFAAEWTLAARAMLEPRAAAALHAAAALLGGAVIAAMYAAGLAFDLRAGWDSTWLDAPAVARLLGIVYAPASWLAGVALPDAAELARWRFAEGSAGERAGRWIHLIAITLALVVVLPRAALAAWQLARARRAEASLALPLDEPYYRALLREAPARTRPVVVLPYSFTLDATRRTALPRVLEDALGPGAQPSVETSLPQGAEDDLDGQLSAATLAAGELVVLFAATATPERESHGAFVRALAARRRAAPLVLVDESGLRERLGAAADAALRLTQRRAAWQRLMHDLSLPEPRFVELK